MIKFLAMDVDGTLTDGKIYMGAEGELFKAFDIKDGYAIHEILPAHDIIPVIITARSSKIVENRCKELGVTEIYQGERDKLKCLKNVMEKYGVDTSTADSLSKVAYIGDDILDLQCMKPIRESGGVVGCPVDAVDEVKKIADYVCTRSAGNGAVREFVEEIIAHRMDNE